MQALKEQVPSKIDTGEEKASSKREPTTPKRGLDALYARYRKLEQRVERLEAVNSTLRRDVMRIDRKQYRELEAPAKTEPKNDLAGLPAGLFGN